jgi:predicted metal-binding membrane protein
MTEQRHYLIPTWVLVVVLVVTGVPNVLWIWANGGISFFGSDPTGHKLLL